MGGGSVLLAMEWSRTHGQRGLVSSWPQFGVPAGLFLANLAVFALQRLVGRPIPRLGLAYSVRAVDHSDRHRPVDPPRHSRDSGVPASPGRQQDRESADYRSRQETAEGDHPLSASADVAAGAVLYLHRLHLRLRGRHPANAAQPDPLGCPGGGGRLALLHTDLWPYL